MLQTHYFVSAVILSLIFFTPTLNAQNISMSDMAADHPACLEHDVELGCLLADFPNALVSRVDGEAFESMKEQDLADTVDLAKEVSDGLEAAKFLGLDLPRYGATAAVKMKALATLKALPATLTWEGFKRNTARVDLLLLSEAEMQDAANELGAILGAEKSALPQLLEADRYWPIIMFYSPKGSSFVRWLTGRDGERDFPISLAAPDATPTQAQSAQNSSWIAPTLNYPEHWLTEELVELRTEPDTLYFITPKEPLDVAGMMDAQLSVAVEGATRGVKNAYAEYDPEAEPVDLLVEAALAAPSAIDNVEVRHDDASDNTVNRGSLDANVVSPARSYDMPHFDRLRETDFASDAPRIIVRDPSETGESELAIYDYSDGEFTLQKIEVGVRSFYRYRGNESSLDSFQIHGNQSFAALSPNARFLMVEYNGFRNKNYLRVFDLQASGQEIIQIPLADETPIVDMAFVEQRTGGISFYYGTEAEVYLAQLKFSDETWTLARHEPLLENTKLSTALLVNSLSLTPGDDGHRLAAMFDSIENPPGYATSAIDAVSQSQYEDDEYAISLGQLRSHGSRSRRLWDVLHLPSNAAWEQELLLAVSERELFVDQGWGDNNFDATMPISDLPLDNPDLHFLPSRDVVLVVDTEGIFVFSRQDITAWLAERENDYQASIEDFGTRISSQRVGYDGRMIASFLSTEAHDPRMRVFTHNTGDPRGDAAKIFDMPVGALLDEAGYPRRLTPVEAGPPENNLVQTLDFQTWKSMPIPEGTYPEVAATMDGRFNVINFLMQATDKHRLSRVIDVGTGDFWDTEYQITTRLSSLDSGHNYVFGRDEFIVAKLAGEPDSDSGKINVSVLDGKTGQVLRTRRFDCGALYREGDNMHERCVGASNPIPASIYVKFGLISLYHPSSTTFRSEDVAVNPESLQSVSKYSPSGQAAPASFRYTATEQNTFIWDRHSVLPTFDMARIFSSETLNGISLRWKRNPWFANPNGIVLFGYWKTRETFVVDLVGQDFWRDDSLTPIGVFYPFIIDQSKDIFGIYDVTKRQVVSNLPRTSDFLSGELAKIPGSHLVLAHSYPPGDFALIDLERFRSQSFSSEYFGRYNENLWYDINYVSGSAELDGRLAGLLSIGKSGFHAIQSDLNFVSSESGMPGHSNDWLDDSIYADPMNHRLFQVVGDEIRIVDLRLEPVQLPENGCGKWRLEGDGAVLGTFGEPFAMRFSDQREGPLFPFIFPPDPEIDLVANGFRIGHPSMDHEFVFKQVSREGCSNQSVAAQ